jgi:hypothetical protein
MLFKIATTLAATMGVTSAQSWSDTAGLCPKAYAKEPKDWEENASFYPKKEEISLESPSLQDLVMEFDPKTVEAKPYAKCMYFATTPVPGYEREFSERFCILKKDKGTFDGIAGADPKKVVNVTIPLWNVKKIETTVLDETGIQDITFTMRYTNFTSPDKYYDDTDFATLDT